MSTTNNDNTTADDNLFPCQNIAEVEEHCAHLGRMEVQNGCTLDPAKVSRIVEMTDFSKHFDRKLSPREQDIARGAFVDGYKSALQG